jgi:CelD/BcsL family acetyltransferase involved in cellulose biosynthesis
MSALVIAVPRSPVTEVTVETITDLEGFGDVRAEWTALLAQSPADCLFLTWEWLHTWWKHLAAGRRLSIVAVRCRGELIALAPLALTAGRRAGLAPLSSLTFLGTGSVGSDYLDVIVARGREAEAYDALLHALAGQSYALDLAQLHRGASAAVGLAARLARLGWHCAERPTDLCPYIDLRGVTWSAYLASLDGHHRSNFKRRLGHLGRAFSMRFERVETERERAEALGAFFALHGERWQGRGGSTAFYSPALCAFHEEWTRVALERGWLRLFLMRLDGRPVGAIYGFRYRGTFGFYQTGFDPAYARHGIGQVMVGLSIKSAIEEGADEYDLLHGTERYKSDWARGMRELARIEAYPPSVRGRIHGRLASLDRRARRLARGVLAGLSRSDR